jgi:hypothetical protein
MPDVGHHAGQRRGRRSRLHALNGRALDRHDSCREGLPVRYFFASAGERLVVPGAVGAGPLIRSFELAAELLYDFDLALGRDLERTEARADEVAPVHDGHA